MRIGELARAAGMTPRTVRYYEEIGLLPESGERAAGAHREYGDEDLARLRELCGSSTCSGSRSTS